MCLISTLSNFFVEDFHYCNLATQSGIKIGIAVAKEMGVEPDDRSKNTVILQFEVEDLEAFFAYLKQQGCSGLFGDVRGCSVVLSPTCSEKDNFWFAGFKDLEGKPCWVVDKNCP